MFITKLYNFRVTQIFIYRFNSGIFCIQSLRNCYSILSEYPPISIRLFRTFILFKKLSRFVEVGGGKVCVKMLINLVIPFKVILYSFNCESALFL